MAQEEQSQAGAGKNQKLDAEINLSIRFLSEELLQISELSEMERGYATELASYLKQFLEPLGTPFHIKPSSILKSDNSLADVVLTPQGTLILMHNNGMVNSKALESLQTETLLRILNELIPEIKTSLAERRQKISGRVGMLEKATREFRRVPPPTPQTTGAAKRPAQQTVASQSGFPVQQSKDRSNFAGQSEKQKNEDSSDSDQSQDALKAALTGN